MYKVTFPLSIALINGRNGKAVIKKAGAYTMIRIPNPLYPKQFPWLVIEGTLVGLAEAFFWDLENENMEIFKVKIERIEQPHV